MALTPLRWVTAAAAGCAIALALVLSFDPARRTWRYSDRELIAERLSRLDRAATSVARQLRATLLVDSVESALARMPRSQGSRVVAARSFRRGAEFSALLTKRIGAAALAGGAPIDVVLLVDSASVIRGKSMYLFTRITHVLPATRDGRCMAIVRFAPRAERDGLFALQNSHIASEILGPCGYYASFGAPGAGVDRWLRGNGWAFGTHAAGYRRATFATQDWMGSWMFGSIPWAADAGFPLRGYVGSDGYGCVAGVREACLRAVLSPKVTSRRLGMERVTGDGFISRPLVADLYYANNAFGVASHDLLSDMVASLGDDKFRRFWTSDQPPAEAFLAATGEELGAWLARWATERYGEARRGPGAPADGTFVSFLVALGAVVAATAAARRRQVA